MATSCYADPKITIDLGNKRYTARDISAAGRFIATHFGCQPDELTCETDAPFTRPFPGRSVWVYHGEFDADTAAYLSLPAAVFKIWDMARA